jgi:hypothetical protein
MGLDMYLTKRTYVQNWDYMKESEKNYVTIKGANEEHIKSERIQYITEQLMYWRKANQIHGWFVENVQDGIDDCGEYAVDLSQLIQLMDVCYEVMTDNSKAEELLPTSRGFFFGGYDYDDFYFTQVTNTYKILNELVKELESNSKQIRKDSWIEYRASW